MLSDAAFADAGAQIGDPWGADVVVKVSPPSPEEIARLSGGSVLVGFLAPRTRPDVLEALAGAGVTAFAMESIPRISRAQSMDALSSQSNVSGYKAVLVAADADRSLLPDAHDRRGDDPAGQGPRARRGRRRAAGHRDGAAAGRGRHRLRRARCRRRAGPVARRDVPRARGRERRRGRGRLRARADRGGARGPAARADRGDHGLRRRHHDGAGPGPPRAAPRHRRGGEGDAAGQRHRRPRRRGGRQLRAHRAGGDGGARGRDDRLAAEPAGDDARARLLAVRAQRAVVPGARHGGRRAEAGFRRRDRQGRLRRARAGEVSA